MKSRASLKTQNLSRILNHNPKSHNVSRFLTRRSSNVSKYERVR